MLPTQTVVNKEQKLVLTFDEAVEGLYNTQLLKGLEHKSCEERRPY